MTLPETRPESDRNAMLATFCTIVLFVVGVGRTLPWLEFSNSMENLNVATVLEMARGGPKLVPTLEGRPRIEKPPLTAWVTSLGVRASTLAQLDDPTRATRDAAYKDLSLQIRLTALLTSALTLLAIYDLGKTVAGARVGAISVAVCASSFFFLRFGRFATTDVQLTLWLTVAHAFLARAIFNGVTFANALGAGVALGLAFMSKGPVALVQSLLPVIVFIAWQRKSITVKLRAGPIVLGAVVMIGVALWWFLLAARQDPSIVKRWLSETNPAGGERISGRNYLLYLILFPFMLPWTAFLIDGLIRIPRARSRATYAVVVLVVTVIVMSCFVDRKDRYILPMVSIASVIAATSFAATLDRVKGALPLWAHWIALVAISLLPLLGTTPRFMKTIDGRAWFDGSFAITSSLTAMIAVIIGAMLYYRGRVRYAPIGAAVVMMLILQAVMIQGYHRSREGMSEMKPLADHIRVSYRDAEMYNFRDDGVIKRSPVDLSIYLNRPTRWTNDLGALPASDRPQIYVTARGTKEDEPAAAPGWLPFERIARDKDFYYAFVRVPR